MGIEGFGYKGKRTLVVGGSSGMGAATARLLAELGADVAVADYAPVSFPVSKVIKLDLREPATIDRALEELKAPIHAVFSCAGVAEVPGVMQVNFLGQRHLIEGMMHRDLLPPGSAIAMISSTAGLGWENDLDMLGELLDTASFEEGVAWVDSHPVRSYYALSKKAVCAYVARQGYPLLKRGVRINAMQPGPTDTPLARANARLWLASGREYREAAGIDISRPDEQAYVLAFLCSSAASYVTAISIVTDGGRTSARKMHGFPI
jgi:NAD(P)-dependent dehydrogenase (short-subunit alcohol dehydrogenase family)